MVTYIGMFLFLLMLWLSIYGQKQRTRSIWEKICCILATILFVTMAALRGSTVGADTADYIRDYEVYKNYSYDLIFKFYDYNPSYYIVSKIFANIGFSVRVWFGFVALLYVGAVTNIVRKYSQDVAFSYIMFLGLGFYAFSLAALKQILAMTFTLWAFDFLIKKKYVRFFVFVLLGMTFHLSCVVFVLAFFVFLIRKTKYFYSTMIAVFVACAMTYSALFNVVMQYLDNEHYNTYLGVEEAYSPTVLIVQLAILATCLFFIKWYKQDKDENVRIFFGVACLGPVMQLFAFIVASAFRISMYFSIFSIILLPNCISMQKDVMYKRIWKISLMAIFVFYFMYTNRGQSSIVPYVFYWK